MYHRFVVLNPFDSGNGQPAFQAHLWHFPVFRTCNVRMKIGLLCTFSSGRVTLGNAQFAFLCSYSSCSKSFWDLPPRRRPCKACPSQNDDFLPRFGIHPLWKAFQGTSIPKRFGTTLFRPLCGPSRPSFAASLPRFAASGFPDV